MIQLLTGCRCTFRTKSPISLVIRVGSLQLPKCQQQIHRNMATVKDSIPHVVRTAQDQRQQGFYSATIGRIEQVNDTIRLYRLYLDNDQVGGAPWSHVGRTLSVSNSYNESSTLTSSMVSSKIMRYGTEQTKVANFFPLATTPSSARAICRPLYSRS